ncbi:YwpF family protein [Shouchella sp. JSM 1781072]|uniref:YwpF family protein n=1 Tax=Shouchella sp. JSM 1781072 TaxID=3344581 RepID=UPI0035C05E69
MKTFKLYAMQVIDGQQGNVKQEPIPLHEGLIINMENEEHTWFIDAVISKDDARLFEREQEGERHILVSVVITSKDNHPAVLITSIESITDLKENKSIILKGQIVSGRDDVLEDVFEDLLEEGIQRESLLLEYKSRVEKLDAYSDKTIAEVYDQLKKSEKYHLY